MSLQITNIKATSKKAKQHTVRESFHNSHLVTSAASGITYRTRLNPIASCTCDWAKYHRADEAVACSHVQATVAYVKKQDGYNVKMFASSEDVSHHHRRVVRIGNGVKATARKTAVKPIEDDLNDLLFG